MTLEDEEKRATEMLAGKIVSAVRRHRANELIVEFTDGTRMFVDAPREPIELSITGDFAND